MCSGISNRSTVGIAGGRPTAASSERKIFALPIFLKDVQRDLESLDRWYCRRQTNRRVIRTEDLRSPDLLEGCAAGSRIARPLVLPAADQPPRDPNGRSSLSRSS